MRPHPVSGGAFEPRVGGEQYFTPLESGPSPLLRGTGVMSS
jgi:hypothetical protein